MLKINDKVTVIGKEGEFAVSDIKKFGRRKVYLLEDSEGYTAGMYEECELEPPIPQITCRVEFEDAGNVIVAHLIATVNGKDNEVAIGHGHKLHDGMKGFFQACSWAMKKAYEKFNESGYIS